MIVTKHFSYAQEILKEVEIYGISKHFSAFISQPQKNERM